MMEDNPLKAKKRAQPTPETELSTEMQLMEDKFIIYDFNKVRRSHSLNRGKIMRTGTNQSTNVVSASGYHDLHKINSTSTLDGTLVATRNSTGRIEQLPMMGAPPPKIPRPESPSDRVGQDRFNPDEDKLSLISTDLSHHTGAKHEVTQTQAQNPRVSIYRLQEKAEECEDEAVVMLPATTAIPVAPQQSFSHERFTSLPLSGSPDPPQHPLIQQHQRQQYANSTTPSSPSNSSGHSSLSTPPTTHNSSPATQKLGAAGAILFSAPDSGASLSSVTPSGTPLMDSASIFNASRPRPRGREGQFNSSMSSPLGANQTRSTQPYSTPSTARSGRSFEILASTQQQQQGTPARPMSAYTASHASHDEGFQETKSLTMAYIPTLLSQNGFQTSSTISGMGGLNETPSEVAGDTYQG